MTARHVCLAAAWRVACCAVVLGTPVAAQGPPFDGRRLPVRVDTFTILMFAQGDTVEGGWAIDALVTDGRYLTRVFEEDTRLFGRRVDTTVVRLDDLRPISRVSVRSHDLTRLLFHDDSVRSWSVNMRRETTMVAVPLPLAVYDGATFDLLVRASELGAGAHVDVPAFYSWTDSIGRLRALVVGSEAVNGADCWLVQGSDGAMPIWFWIDKQSRELRRRLVGRRGETGVLFERRRPRMHGRGT